MDNELLNTLINAGSAGILLFLYMRLEQRFDALQKQLHEMNLRMWALLENLISQNDDLTASEIRRFYPPPEMQ